MHGFVMSAAKAAVLLRLDYARSARPRTPITTPAIFILSIPMEPRRAEGNGWARLDRKVFRLQFSATAPFPRFCSTLAPLEVRRQTACATLPATLRTTPRSALCRFVE